MFTRSLITAEPWPGPGRVVNPIVKTESGNKIFMSGCKTCAGHHQPHIPVTGVFVYKGEHRTSLGQLSL